ncbi:DUF898 family protein [Oscillospiraceae bacterium MB08-C2-2]|nr:DUF898 family protein [Oscillospiraceae bacterium MB08-C2-2]
MNETTVNTSTPQVNTGNSYFDGEVLQFIGRSILASLICSFTFSICFPWALCMVYGWKIDHTVIQGRRLKFVGTPMGLFGSWIKWLLLTAVTFGIYGFWACINLEKWVAQNTTYAD